MSCSKDNEKHQLLSILFGGFPNQKKGMTLTHCIDCICKDSGVTRPSKSNAPPSPIRLTVTSQN